MRDHDHAKFDLIFLLKPKMRSILNEMNKEGNIIVHNAEQ